MARVACRWLWTGAGEEPRKNALIELDGGRISGISAGGDGELFVMPAFVDAHCHFTQMGLFGSAVDLSSAGSAQDVLNEVARKAGRGEGPIRGEAFDESCWSDPLLPTLSELDRVSGGRPLFLRRVCCHLALMNTAMMAMYRDDEPGIDRATGIAREAPVLDYDRRFPPSEEDLAPALRKAAGFAHAAGVTGICTMERLGDARRLLGLNLPLDISSAVLAEDLRHLSEHEGLLGVKCFLDGSVGAGTAAMDCRSDGGDFLLYADEELEDLIRSGFEKGLPPVMHAIGGRAVDQAVSTSLRALGGTELPRRLRWARIEHAEELGGVLGSLDPSFHRICAQPNFVDRWQRPEGLYGSSLGWKCARGLNPFADAVESGVELGFGSDCMPFGPLRGLAGAVGHPVPSQRLSVGQALRAYTLGAAALSGFDSLSKPLHEGGRADLVALSRNPFERGSFDDLEVVATMRLGEVVFEGGKGLMV